MAIGKSIDFLLNQMRCFSGSLQGGSAEFFFPGGSTTQQGIYLDQGLTQPAANPYPLSADGTAELFGSGTYRILIRNAAGVIVYDYDFVEILATNTGGGGGGGTTGNGAVQVLVPTSASGAAYLLNELFPNQYVTRTGDNLGALTITQPGSYSIYGGATPRTLFADGETMHFLLLGNVFYVV